MRIPLWKPTARHLLMTLACTVPAAGPTGLVAQDGGTGRVASTRRSLPTWLEGALSFHLSPHVRFNVGSLSGDASALLGGARQELTRLEGRTTVAVGLPNVSAFRIESEIGAFRTRGGPDIRAHGLEGTARFMHQSATGVVWLGGSLASSWADETNRRARILSGGAWKRLGHSVLGLTLRGVEYDEEIVLGRDTTYEVLGFPFRSERSEQIVYDHYYVDASLLASHQVGPVALHLEWGGRLTRRSVRERRSWIRGGVEVPILSDVMLQVAAGQRPHLPEYRIEAGSFVTVGLALNLGRNSWDAPAFATTTPLPNAPSAELESRGADMWELTILNMYGTRMEIMGDPTNWQIVEMDPTGLATWRTTLHMPPGTHRVNIRVSGGSWQELPGYPTARDEFGGVVGVIVIADSGGAPDNA